MTPDSVCFSTACEQARRIRAREISCEALIEAHLNQIRRVNPAVNAIVTLLAEPALENARRADRALAVGDAVGPLHGLPIAHKDLALTRGVRTTFGSVAMKDFVPVEDALIVERLRGAGAIMLGKTNTPEFGAGSQTFNAVFGVTRNPYDLSKTCGGSSGGAAVALASGLLPIADGSDMGGSLRNPAAFCNVVGLRPTPGRVPSWPTDLAWTTLAVEGPMARTVEDTALMLSAMAGPDPKSPLALADSGERFRQPLARDFRGARIAFSEDFGGTLPFEPAIVEIVARARPVFEHLGCEIAAALPDLRDADEVFKAWRAWIYAALCGDLLREHRKDLKDTLVWNIEQGLRLTGPELGRAENKRTALYHRCREFFQTHEFLVLPVTQVAPFDAELEYPTEIDGEPMPTYLDWMRSCYYITATGHPAISVPCGFTPAGLPVGLQIVGRYGDDFGVLQLGYAYQQQTAFWKQHPSLARNLHNRINQPDATPARRKHTDG